MTPAEHIAAYDAVLYRKRQREAFGPQRRMAPATKARNVAASILAHSLDLDAPETWSRYGLTEESPQGQLVLEALTALTHGNAESIRPLGVQSGDIATLVLPYCSCGRLAADCDNSRRACKKVQPLLDRP